MKKFKFKRLAIQISMVLSLPTAAIAQSTLPFPPTPTASTAKETMAESTHKRRVEPARLPANAPNIIIILMDDVGPGTPSTYGGLVNTPNLSRVADKGVSFNQFHSTAMSSPTRASLLTGRNHTRIGNGQITEWANDWDGYSGVIPKTAATLPEILKNYGYSTSAFGKWHNTPMQQTSAAGPFDFWPTGYGFEYFYGFLAGESGQYEPTLVRNTQYVKKLPKTAEEGYHLTDDLADEAIQWIREQREANPDKPLFMYWAPGAAHGPHQVAKKWADKYDGQFDFGWDKYREIVFERQKKLGFIPQDAKLTARPDSLAAWDSIPANQREFQTRLMEVFAGFAEHADYNAGRILDELDRQKITDNTLVFYIWGDNGSSAEGQNGTISELLAQNQIPSKIEEHIDVLNKKLGGLDAIGSPKTDNMYHAGWGWAGSTPFKGTKLLASYFGGTRQPMAISWPKSIQHDTKMRSQFHHVNDIAPTVYDILKIETPKVVNGFQQVPMDGVSMKYTFNNAKAPDQKKTQFFDVMASRAIYSDGWMASTFGPRVPWLTVTPGLTTWTPDKDVWELYNLKNDFTQANDLAKQNPKKLEELKTLFLEESKKNSNLPIGGGLYVLLHPEEIQATSRTDFTLSQTSTMRESTSPRVAAVPNRMLFDINADKKPEGVLFAVGGFSGGLSLYIDQEGYLNYEYNLFHVDKTILKSKQKLGTGAQQIEVVLTKSQQKSPRGDQLPSGDLVIKVNGQEFIQGHIPTLITAAFTVNDTMDIGRDLGSPVSETYYHQAPYAFNGEIQSVNVKYLK